MLNIINPLRFNLINLTDIKHWKQVVNKNQLHPIPDSN